MTMVKDNAQKVGDAASHAYDAARERASTAGDRTAQVIGDYPVGAVVAGLALGAVAGALLPRTSQEDAVLGPIGARVGEAARAATQAAREASRTALEEQGLRDGVREQATKLTEVAKKAAQSAGSAATSAVRGG